MSQGQGFKHISVTAADEEDVVIRAGVSAAAQDGPEASEAAEAVQAEAEAAQAEARAAQAAGAAQAEARAAGAAQASDTAQAKEAAAPGKREAYREPTLEDLQPTPMPLAQKVTIGAAVLCIIGAVVYYIAFLG